MLIRSLLWYVPRGVRSVWGAFRVGCVRAVVDSGYRNLKRAMDKETALSEELAECRRQQEELESQLLSKLKDESEDMLRAYNDNLEKCKVGHRPLTSCLKF